MQILHHGLTRPWTDSRILEWPDNFWSRGIVPMGAHFDTSRISTSAIPFLTMEAEYDLIRRWQADQDAAARERLLRAHRPMLVAAATTYAKKYGVPKDDLIAEGYIALMRVMDRFELERGTRFSTFARFEVRHYMQEFASRNWSVVRLGTTARHKALLFQINAAVNKVDEESGGTLSRRAIAERLVDRFKLSVDEIETMIVRRSRGEVSLDTPIGMDGDQTIVDAMPADDLDPEAATIQSDEAAIKARLIRDALKTLPDRQRAIIEQRFMVDADGITTLDTLAKRYGISRERVRQIEQSAIKKLKDHLLTAAPSVFAPAGRAVARAGAVAAAAFGFALGLLAAAQPIQAHDFYERACCSDKDCRPLAFSDVQVTPQGYVIKSTGETIPFDAGKIRATPPEDAEQRYHICRRGGQLPGAIICFYAPSGGV